jgi:hypothetical protein
VMMMYGVVPPPNKQTNKSLISTQFSSMFSVHLFLSLVSAAAVDPPLSAIPGAIVRFKCTFRSALAMTILLLSCIARGPCPYADLNMQAGVSLGHLCPPSPELPTPLDNRISARRFGVWQRECCQVRRRCNR